MLRSMKKCSKCKENKELSEFGLKNKAKGIYQGYCKLCQRAYAKKDYSTKTKYYKDKSARNNPKYRKQNQQFIYNYLMEHPCIDCGETDIEILQFDHIEMVRGRGNRVTSLLSHSIERIITEINKCEVRCANCHLRRTRRQMGWDRTTWTGSPMAEAIGLDPI